MAPKDDRPPDEVKNRYAPDVHQSAERRKPEQCQSGENMDLVAEGYRVHERRIGRERHYPPYPGRNGVQYVVVAEKDVVEPDPNDENETTDGDRIVQGAHRLNTRVGQSPPE